MHLPSRLRPLAIRTHTALSDLYTKFQSLSLKQRLTISLLVLFKFLLFLIFVIVGPDEIFNKTAAIALWFSHQPFGALLLILIVVIVSFPPLFGYGTAITLCGLGWGVEAPATKSHSAMNGSLLQGWALASIACLVGSSISFVVLRWIINRNAAGGMVKRIYKDDKFRAMSEAVRRKGLKIIVLIRFCPFPFFYSNLFFASLRDSISFGQFILATTLITPKLLLHVFIGARVFQLMDHEQRAKLDGWGKFLNISYIVIGTLIGTVTGWMVWRETSKVLDTLQQEQSFNLTTQDPNHDDEFVISMDSQEEDNLEDEDTDTDHIRLLSS